MRKRRLNFGSCKTQEAEEGPSGEMPSNEKEWLQQAQRWELEVARLGQVQVSVVDGGG